MANPPADTDTSAKTLEEQFVPLEKRESRNVSWTPFLIETLKFFIVTKLSALAGYFGGKELAKRNVTFGKFKISPQWSSIAAGATGGMYELFHHWKKEEGRRLGVKNVSGDLKAALDPAQLEKESRKENAIIADLKTLEQKLAAPTSHRDAIATRREETPPEAGLGV